MSTGIRGYERLKPPRKDSCMKIAISGSTGLIGQRLVADLAAAGHQVISLVRHDPIGSDILWRTEGPLDPAALRGIQAIVHLAGEPIGGGRWTQAQKRRILQSRVQGTTTIATAMAKADKGPTVLISMSAIGLYGDRGDEILSEKSDPGEDFLAHVVQAWEAAADPARQAGVRVVHPRAGIVLDPNGGALQKLLPLFKLGLGGRFGKGDQWWSWVSIDDVVGLIQWALLSEEAEGPYNVTAPEPVTNAEFTRHLARALGRPALLPVPAFAPRLLLGELADALLFNSQRVEPVAAMAQGYQFAFPDLPDALRQVLRPRTRAPTLPR
ncbi:MAG: TIGR01777 family oxidoreductase [Euzebya sp.]